MNQVDRYINRSCKKSITNTLKHMACDHVWFHYGHGYKCQKCDWYTGLNTKLNKLIEKQYGGAENIPDGNFMAFEKKRKKK